jgi:hypothetical protein
MRKAFALLAALVFVAFVVAMGTIYLRQVGGVQKLGILSSSIAQQNALITDAITILQNQAALVSSDEALTIFLASASNISYDGNGYNLKITSESLQNKIAFGECEFEHNSSTVCKNIMQTILAQSGGNLTETLLTLLQNTPNELNINDSSFANAKIKSYARFTKLLDYYSSVSKDSVVNKIAWRDYFVFSNTLPSYLDCQNMPLKLWNIVAFTYSIGYSDCASFLKKEPNSKIAKELKLQNFKNGDSYFVRFTIVLEQNNTALGKIALDYDIGKKKAVAVEAF